MKYNKCGLKGQKAVADTVNESWFNRCLPPHISSDACLQVSLKKKPVQQTYEAVEHGYKNCMLVHSAGYSKNRPGDSGGNRTLTTVYTSVVGQVNPVSAALL